MITLEERLNLLVEPHELKNKEIYKQYGFTEYIKTSTEIYPDETTITAEYYRKEL